MTLKGKPAFCMIATGTLGQYDGEDVWQPKKDGEYLVRMINRKGTYFYDFVSYYKTRGWLTNRTVTHWVEIENPQRLDQDSD